MLDTVNENGPRLVEAEPETAEIMNRGDSGLRMVPLVEYLPPDPKQRPLAGGPGLAGAGPAHAFTLTITDAATGLGVAGAHVVAFTNFATRAGAEALSDANGDVAITLPGPAVDRLYVYPPLSGYWGAFRHTLDLSQPLTVALTPINLGFTDCVRHYYSHSNFDLALGVEVGVIDTGVGPHTDLNLVGGANTVTGEPPLAFDDTRGHGTHVAGLIGSNGGLRGVAPGVRLRAYRVFGAGTGGATNYAILKAMWIAARDGCDIINLSLGGGPQDPIVAEAVNDARNQGMLVVVATGNDNRANVSFPAAYPGATAISAMGRQGTFPVGSLDEAEVVRPPLGLDPAEFIAGFSNVGTEVAATGPGVGALSTIFGDRFGAMSGTSMAAPVVAGAVACLLSRDAVIHAMPRDAARADAIAQLLEPQPQAAQVRRAVRGPGDARPCHRVGGWPTTSCCSAARRRARRTSRRSSGRPACASSTTASRARCWSTRARRPPPA